MKALLIDVDSKIPNLALMQLSTYLKGEGYEVQLVKFKDMRGPIEADAVFFKHTFEEYDRTMSHVKERGKNAGC